MTVGNMPPAEQDVTPELVRRLIEDQRPDLAGRSVRFLAHGWDNELFRLGDDLVGRFPRRELAARLVENEARWLPTFADDLPLPIPSPVFLGVPGGGYPWSWVLVPWIDGEPLALSPRVDLDTCAVQLGEFLAALHSPAPADAPDNPYRGVPLADRDGAMRERIASLGDLIDARRVTSLWEEALSAATHAGPALWVHGDLHPQNLLVVEGRLSGVIDFGDVTAGDPTYGTELGVGGLSGLGSPAWSLFDGVQRSVFFSVYGDPDPACLIRARGWALALAVAYIANSADNPVMSSIGERMYAEAIGDV